MIRNPKNNSSTVQSRVMHTIKRVRKGLWMAYIALSVLSGGRVGDEAVVSLPDHERQDRKLGKLKALDTSLQVLQNKQSSLRAS